MEDNTKLFKINGDLWHKFKIICAIQNKTIKSKLTEMIKKEVDINENK